MADQYTKGSLSADAAQRILAAAAEKAEALGSPSTIAIMDESARHKALLRMDGASVLSVEVATRKAYTAASTGFPTAAFYDAIKDDPPLAAAIPALPGVSAFGGGVPITIDGQVVGTVGVAGGHWTQDVEIAEAAIAAVTG